MKRETGQRITLAHGAGGRRTHALVNDIFRRAFSNPSLDPLDDAAIVPGVRRGRIACTTDAFVVHPIFFPGGDIGRLSICGSVNDLAMKGARPLGISIAAIIEEGFPLDELRRIVSSAAAAAREARVPVITGDTKVVEKGKADRIFLTTSGVGEVRPGAEIGGANARPGDCVLINGPIAEHGVAVLAARDEFKLRTAVRSDCAPLNGLVERMLDATKAVHVLRDPTRGGVATALNEIAAASNVGIILDEKSIPVAAEVRAACAILGLDPLYIANEGKLLCCAPASLESRLMRVMRSTGPAAGAARIGTVVRSPKGVWLKTAAGGLRPLIMLEGEQLPRIC